MKLYKILVVLSLLLLPFLGRAQSDFDLSQRWFNQALYNPAAAGADFTMGIYFHGRQQWAAMSGAPLTGVLSADTQIKPLRSGIGVAFSGDRIGITNTYKANLSYSFFVPIGRKSVLSLGLSGGFQQRNVDATGSLVDDLDDPLLLLHGRESESSPNFSIGALFQGPFKAGFSIRNLGTEASDWSANSRSIWAYASIRLGLPARLNIEPMLAYTYRDELSRVEAGATLYFLRPKSETVNSDWAWLSGVYRIGLGSSGSGQLALMGGIALNKHLSVGYSFDYGIGQLGRISKFGTHEIMVVWKFNRVFHKRCPCEDVGKSEKMNKFF